MASSAGQTGNPWSVSVITLLISSLWCQVAPCREWTDATGAYKLEAEYAGYINGQVRLRKESGEIVSVPITKLSEADQEFIKSKSRTVGRPTLNQTNDRGDVDDPGDPKPGSKPQFDTPLGYYVETLKLGAPVVPGRLLTGATGFDPDNMTPTYEDVTWERSPGNMFVYLHFYAQAPTKKAFEIKECMLTADDIPCFVMGYKRKLTDARTEGIGHFNAVEHAWSGSTYLLFEVPRHKQKYEFVYKDNTLPLKLRLR